MTLRFWNLELDGSYTVAARVKKTDYGSVIGSMNELKRNARDKGPCHHATENGFHPCSSEFFD